MNFPEMTLEQAAVIVLMDRYFAGGLDPYVTPREISTLMYFLKEAGEPLDWDYREGPRGPHTDDIHHAIDKIGGHLISGYGPFVVMPKALEDARIIIENKETTRSHLERVFDLMDGFESPFGLELLSTTHWMATRKQLQSAGRIASAWERGRFSERQALLALDVLTQKGWVII